MRRLLSAASLAAIVLSVCAVTALAQWPWGGGNAKGGDLPFPYAQPEEVGMSAQHLGRATEIIKDLIDARKVAGASYAVLRHGKVVALETLGYQDAERKIPMQKDTIFRVFSQSKPISTAAFLTLIDEGRVGLDDPVALYLPEFANVRVQNPAANAQPGDTVPLVRPMLIRHLLTHTAGLTYGFMDNTPVDQLYNKNNILDPHEELDAKIKRVSRLPLINQPGDKWNYGLSTDVLILIASKVTGLSVEEFLQQRLFGPLGMKDTGFYVPAAKADKLAVVYQRNDNGQGYHRPNPDPNNIQLLDYTKKPAYLAAGGGLLTSLIDMMKFGQMLLNGGELNGVRVLKPETVAAMTHDQVGEGLLPLKYNPQIVMKDVTFGYGIGIQIPYTDDGKGNIQVPRPGEFSWGGGMSTNFWVSPSDDTVVVTMVQIMPFTEDLKFAARDWTYRAIDAFAKKSQGGATATTFMFSPATMSYNKVQMVEVDAATAGIQAPVIEEEAAAAVTEAEIDAATATATTQQAQAPPATRSNIRRAA